MRDQLTDRQAADAVRTRIDWKYVLSLELTNSGFDFSILSEFRGRLLAHGAERRLFDRLLEQFRERGWIKARGKQRTDSTHVLAAIRTLRRLECVGETMRHALDVLAEGAPTWLLEHRDPRIAQRDFIAEQFSRRFPAGLTSLSCFFSSAFCELICFRGKCDHSVGERARGFTPFTTGAR